MIFLVTLVMAIKSRDSRYLLERIGIYRSNFPQGCIWFHAASVGEVNGIMPLLTKMACDNPNATYILTTGTPTGGQVALNKIPDNTVHAYLPLDYPGAVRRFLNKTRPSSAVIMETELWAELFYACDQREIPISIINARLSDRTLKTNAWMYRLYAETLNHVSKILARSEEDANGFMTIGATSSKIKVIGNIKLAPMDVSNIQELSEIKRPYVLAASTHEDEEYQLAKMWLETQPDRLLVIAPRHPKRRDNILKSLRKMTDKVAVRSLGQDITEETVIYLADSLGELQSLYKGAEVVIMGGSFVPRGGHNIIEPARFRKAILFGPHMFNFKDETNLLKSNRACIQVQNTDELAQQLVNLHADQAAREELELNAYNAINRSGDIIEKYIRALEEPYSKYHPESFF